MSGQDKKKEPPHFLSGQGFWFREKLKNRRVSVGQLDAGCYGIVLKTLFPENPKGQRIIVTAFAATPEVMASLIRLSLMATAERITR